MKHPPGADTIDGLLRSLNADQRAAVTSTGSPLRILAGAGSGKTRVLTHRIAYLAETGEADPARVLAVTFTRKAAAELRERLGRLGLRQGIQAGTFHAIAYAQLRQRWEERGIRPPELMDRKVGFIARLCPSGSRTLPLDVTAEIEWASARLVEPEDYPAAAVAADRDPPLIPMCSRRSSPATATPRRSGAWWTSTTCCAWPHATWRQIPSTRPRGDGASDTCTSTSSRT
ncbi:MAG: UvrD-helicase domain-containing protein [Microthrixaceae bacterium]|nr:UvrD-helicase domain-containing protein [Microthrixaceae bacterium]